MVNKCPLCPRRISEWEMANNKCMFINGVMVHIACLIDQLPTQVIEKCKPK